MIKTFLGISKWREAAIAFAIALFLVTGCLLTNTTAAMGTEADDYIPKTKIEISDNEDETYSLSLIIEGNGMCLDTGITAVLSSWVIVENNQSDEPDFVYSVTNSEGEDVEVPDSLKTAVYDETFQAITWLFGEEYNLEDEYTYKLTVVVSFADEVYEIADALEDGTLEWNSDEIDWDGFTKNVTESVCEYYYSLINEATLQYRIQHLENEGNKVSDILTVSIDDDASVLVLSTDVDEDVGNQNGTDADSSEKNTNTMQDGEESGAAAGARLPSTGGSGTVTYMLCGLVIMILTMIGIFFLKNKEIYND